MTNRAHWLMLWASFTLIFAAGGWQVAFAAALVSLSTMFVAFAVTDSQKAERVWIVTTLAVWAVIGLLSTQSGLTPCGPDDPAGCFIRR